MRVSTLDFDKLITDGWNDVLVLYPDGNTMEHKTLCSMDEMEQFCKAFGYRLLAYRPGILQLSDNAFRRLEKEVQT